MKSLPIVVLPNLDRTSTSAYELLHRQDTYFKYYKEAAGGSEKALVFFTGNYDDLDANRWNSITPIKLGPSSIPWLIFPFILVRYLKKEKIKPSFVVAGTPFQPYAIALITRLLLPKLKIQVSVHGEISGVRGKGISGWLKFNFFKATISRANLIRFVTNLQAEQFRPYIANSQKIVVTHVPISLPLEERRERIPRTIGFVGRIQSERNVSEWAAIAKTLKNLVALVIGDGPECQEMKKSLPHAVFLGELSANQLQKRWPEIGVLLSTAPSESFGLAMREAILNGVPVVSRDNAGARELRKLAPELIRIYNQTSEATTLISELLSDPPSQELHKRFRSLFAQEQEASLRRLSAAWFELSKSS
jgi:glycosyltransferase involved in cell wall biosynthesis